jgi:hypothetical protein
MRCLCLTLLFAMMPGMLFAKAEVRSTGASLSEDLQAVTRFFPRQEGSAGEKELIAWIEARLTSRQIPFIPFDFSQSDFQHSFSSCLRVDLPGKSKDTLLVAVPLNGPPGASQESDGSINIALALDLIEYARDRSLPLSLTVLFRGAEFGDTDGYPMGSTLFLREFQPEYRAAVLYLNLRRVPARVLVRGGGRGIVSPYWLMNSCVAALREAKVAFRVQGDESQVFRMGITGERTAIEPYLKAGYPSAGLEGEYGQMTRQDEVKWLASFAGFLQTFLTASPPSIPEEWDRHYLLLQVGEISMIVSEKAYIAVLAGTLAAALLYSLVSLRGLRKYLRILTRNSPTIIPLAGLSFLFLAAGTYVLQGLLSLRRFPTLWTFFPLDFLALKACIALFLYSVLYNLFRRLPFPRRGSFYSAAAIFFLLVDIGIVAVFNISFTYYFLWAFVFVLLSAMVPNRYAKALLFLPAPFWGLRGLIAVFMAQADPFVHLLLLSPLWGNLLVAGVCLPFILVLLRLGLIFPGRGILRRRVRELVLAGLFLAAGGALGVRLFLFSPFSPSHPQPVAAIQTIETATGVTAAGTTLVISSPAPLGPLSVTDSSGVRTIDPRTSSVSLSLPPTAPPVQISEGSRQFLLQSNVTVRVVMPSRPRVLSATLTAADDFILFDSGFPSVRESPRAYRLLIGAFPPNPLSLQLTLPTHRSFSLTLTMEFDTPLIGATVACGPDAQVSTHVRVVHTLEVKT